jgi:hypothetical protein
VPERLRSPSGCPQLTLSGAVPSFRAASVRRFHPFNTTSWSKRPGHNLIDHNPLLPSL